MANNPSGGFGIYIHWPFCQAKCPYCDFNSHVVAEINQIRWRRAMLSEIRRSAAETGDLLVSSIFFGGGTPSLMQPETVAALIEEIRVRWRCVNDLEVTLEANPTSFEASKFQGFRDGGVNRVSVGVQALSDVDLKRLGRLHTVTEALEAFEMAQKIFARTSFDLIYARQDQTAKDWHAELTQALAVNSDHMSLYQLTVEPGTAFGDRFAQGGLKGLPDDDLSVEIYEITQDLTCQSGHVAYEISNHARDGHQSRHNLIYWRGGSYVGIGPGAHGRLNLTNGRIATVCESDPAKWLAMVEAQGAGELSRVSISKAEQAAEYVMMSLRLNEGARMERLAQIDSTVINPHKLAQLQESGHIILSEQTLRIAPQHRIVLNAILRELLI